MVKRLAFEKRRVAMRTEERPPKLPSKVFKEPPHQWCRPHKEPNTRKKMKIREV